MKLTAQEVYDRLLNVEKIKTLKGQIKFHLGNVDIIVKQKDVVGNIMQEWLQGWFDKNGIEYDPDTNSQMPPDFYLDSSDRTVNLLEVKAFNRSSSPCFDIADFRMYAEEIRDKPYMLHVDYLIFGYDMDDNGDVTIKDVWLKKVWEITRRMENYPLNLQIKDGVIHKIRPGIWYPTSVIDYKMFDSMEDFICAVDETTFKEPKLREGGFASTWLTLFKRNYKAKYGVELKIPRWDDIKDKYDVVTFRNLKKKEEELGRTKEREKTLRDSVNKLSDLIKSAKTDKQKLDANTKLKNAKANLQKIIEKRKELESKVRELKNLVG